jgi:hypothetical protein
VAVTKQQVHEFKLALIEVYRKHGLCLGHEDHEGAFLVRDLTAEDWKSTRGSHIKWLMDAEYSE